MLQCRDFWCRPDEEDQVCRSLIPCEAQPTEEQKKGNERPRPKNVGGCFRHRAAANNIPRPKKFHKFGI